MQLIFISNHTILHQEILVIEHVLTFIVKLYSTRERSFEATLHRLELFSMTATGFWKKNVILIDTNSSHLVTLCFISKEQLQAILKIENRHRDLN